MLTHLDTGIVDAVLAGRRRVMLFGASGTGKSTLAAQLADTLGASAQDCQCISADPGSPAFGLPGMLALGRRCDKGWKSLAQEPLCTLDAGRFRLPLVAAVRRLVHQACAGVLLLDSPGVVRGVAGRELLQGLVEAARVDLVLVLRRPGGAPPLADELAALGVEFYSVQAVEAAQRPGKRARARARTARWDRYLADAIAQQIDLAKVRITGTPPPTDEPDPWIGRQVALLHGQELAAMGEVLALTAGLLTLRAPATVSGAATLLVRDAARSSAGWLESATPFAPERSLFLPPADVLPASAACGGPRLVGRVGATDVALVNGLFGDPLLHVRLRHQPRSLLFDLGEGGRLSARIAHQVSDVFISHAHLDHLGGFLWLLRSRIGDLPPCRLYGPPGLARHVGGLIDGFLWDRVGEYGPAFEVTELHADTLRRFSLRAGYPGRQEPKTLSAADGIVRSEPGFRVRAITLDHLTPVLAYAFEPDQELKVRKDRLRASGLRPGPWLTELKRRLRLGDTNAVLGLSNGGAAQVGELARDLILMSPGKRLVYATDLADTLDNRARLVDFARHAHSLFLEATYAEADAEHARANGHLTSRACGEIAQAAGVSRLVPFHLSRRYAEDPQVLFDELQAACDRVVLPGPA
jgi:ribonuclease BN (tRNA processing enzyme)